ncbi:MAG: IS1634 family transposase [Deltaproteobacteria bacterium]|nr:IS1634 family transposase [Deltaproteobacteria bacterium]
MYVDTAKSIQGGKTYVRHLLRESFRENGKVKHRTIANLSNCSKEEIEAIKLALKHKNKLSTLVPVDKIKTKQGMRIGAICFLKAIAKRTGLIQALGNQRNSKLALWQIFARLIGQGSRLSAVRLAESHAACDQIGLQVFNEDHLYDNLSWLAENQEKIEKRLFAIRHKNKIPRLFLYDVTSSYLEGIQNELAAYGYNRDKKNGKMQIVIGLLTDDNGLPVSVRVFEGNTKDNKTVVDQVRLLADAFGVKNVTFVGDRGMVKQAQINDITNENFHYITAITKPQIEKLIRSGTFQLKLFENKICEVVENDIRYVLRRNPLRAEEIERNRKSKFSKLKELLKTKNTYLSEHPRAKVEVAIKEVNSRIKKFKFNDWIEVKAKGRELGLSVDEKARAEKYRLDGCYVIKTDLSDQSIDADTIHTRYKDLSKVEYAFRTFKNGHLEVRPIFVRKDHRTRGHVFVVMLAYLLENEIYKYWHGIEVTISEGLDELGSLRATEIEIENVKCQKVPRPDGLSKRLLDAAGVRLPSVAPDRKVHVATRKKLVSERKKQK